MLPNEFLVHELHQDRLRQADKIRLTHLVTESLAERLQRYGAALFGQKPENQSEKNNQKFSRN